MFVTGVIRMRTLETKISLKMKLHKNLKRMIQVKMLRKMREKKKETCTKFKFSEMKQNLDCITGFVDSSPQYNKYYLMPREMKQNMVKEQYQRGIQTKISSFLNTVPIILSTANYTK
jgi:hypothetical protein